MVQDLHRAAETGLERVNESFPDPVLISNIQIQKYWEEKKLKGIFVDFVWTGARKHPVKKGQYNEKKKKKLLDPTLE